MFEKINQLGPLPETRYFLLALSLQGGFLLYDEIVLHRQRGLPRWERWGHPIDTFFFALPFAIGGFFSASPAIFLGLSLLSCLLILKDEWIHRGLINGTEGFCHGVLFMLHPVTLYWGYRNLLIGSTLLLQATTLLLVALMLSQLLYWNFIRSPEVT